MPIAQFEGRALVFNNGVIDVRQGDTSLVDSEKIAHIPEGNVAIDNETIIKNANNQLEVPIDENTIYIDQDGFMKAKGAEVHDSKIILCTQVGSDPAGPVGSFTLNQDSNKTITIPIPEGGSSYTAGEHIIINSENVISAEWPEIPEQTQADWSETTSTAASFIKNKPAISKGSGYNAIQESRGTASGNNSHAEGYSTASGQNSHAEGNATTAEGSYSHAEGWWSKATGNMSHAEGYETTASGIGSHAEGYYTIAASDYQHVQGKYNVEDTTGTYADIVGWGTGTSRRKNISSLTTDGDLHLAGDVYIGADDEGNGGTKLGLDTLGQSLTVARTVGGYNQGDTITANTTLKDIIIKLLGPSDDNEPEIG